MKFTSDKQVPIILIHHYRKMAGGGKGHGMDELSGSGKIADSADYVVKVSRSTDPEAVYPKKYCSHVYLQKARGYNESARDIYFIGGTFIDEVPKTKEDIEFDNYGKEDVEVISEKKVITEEDMEKAVEKPWVKGDEISGEDVFRDW